MADILGGRYEIIEKLGGGGMAIVYLAKDRFLDRLVAVKVLREEYIEDPEFIRHFHKEARSVAALNHPNIVNIYDFDADGDPSYLVMEYVEGKTLKEMVLEEGPLPWDTVIDIGIQIANGLAEAHRNHIIHKDVKSHNILVDQSGMVKITDFGIAQMLSSTTITHSKGILGSAHYFSPEQARGERVDEKSDVYSLGIVLYEMLTGQVPFTGDNPVTVALKHIQELPVPLHDMVPAIPEALERIIMHCLEKDKETRYGSMSAVARDLERVQDSKPQPSVTHQPQIPVVRPQSVSHLANDDTLTLPRNMTQKHLNTSQTAASASLKLKKRRNRFQLFLIVIIIILAALATLKISAFFSERGNIEVPDFVRMNITDAEELARNAGLKLEVDEEAYDQEIDKDHIISQTPRSGRKVKKDQVISVVVSKGEREVKVPDLKGASLDEVKDILRKADLKLGDVDETETDEYEENTIIRQSPDSDNKVAPKSKVHVTIAKKPDKPLVAIPDFRGKTLDEAKTMLAGMNLSLGNVEEVYSGKYNKGIILTQSSEPGVKLPEGSTVSFTVAGSKDNGGNTAHNAMRIQFSVPSDGRVDIIQEDSNGTRQVHSGYYRAGDYFNQSFPYQGTGRMHILLNEKEIDTVTLG